MDPIHPRAMVACHSAIWESSQYSDLIVRCGAEEYKLHKAIVCPRSKFFATACNGQYQESQTGIIEMKGDDPSTIRRILTYFYTLDYDDNGEPASLVRYMLDTGERPKGAEVDLTEAEMLEHIRLVNNIAVYAIGGKYDVTELQELAKTKFESLMVERGLRADLPALIHGIFKTTPSTDAGLRDVASRFCLRQANLILGNPQYESMFKDHGQLGLCIFREMKTEKEALLAKLKDHKRRVLSFIDWFPLDVEYFETNQKAIEKEARAMMDHF